MFKIKKITGKICLLAITIATLFSVQVYASVKIAPNKAYQGHPFTIVDTPNGRLTDGSVAVFILDGIETTISLRTHKPGKTAQGELPNDLSPGVYQVIIRRMGETDFDIGQFEVMEKQSNPSITPSEGQVGTRFTITDPKGRMKSGDLVVFYYKGTDPILGVPAKDVVVSADGITLTGTVNIGVELGKNYVSVRPSLHEDSRFKDLVFRVTYSS